MFLWTLPIILAALSSLSLKLLLCSLSRVFVVFKYSKSSSFGFCLRKTRLATRRIRTIIKAMSKKSIRHSNTLRRKNFLPSLILTILLFLGLGALIYFIDPQVTGAIYVFFLVLFFSLLFFFSLVLASSRRGLIVSICLTIFLILRYFGIGNILNFIIILALGLVTELYFGRT